MNLFQLALEGDRSGEREIVVTGPMGQAFTNALNVAYAKRDPVTGEETLEGGVLEGSAMESQAQEVSIMQQLISAVNQDPSPDLDEGLQIYAVDPSDVSPDTVADVVTEIQENPEKEFVLIADDSTPQSTAGNGDLTEKTIEVNNEVALENDLPEEAEDAELKQFFGQFEEIATEALKHGIISDFSVQRYARAKQQQRRLLGSLKTAVEAMGGKVFPTMEAYVEHLKQKRTP